jgi:hypothetical protein
MSLRMITVAAEEAGKAPVNHWVVGGIALAILLALILGLLAFGAGREHS